MESMDRCVTLRQYDYVGPRYSDDLPVSGKSILWTSIIVRLARSPSTVLPLIFISQAIFALARVGQLPIAFHELVTDPSIFLGFGIGASPTLAHPR